MTAIIPVYAKAKQPCPVLLTRSYMSISYCLPIPEMCRKAKWN